MSFAHSFALSIIILIPIGIFIVVAPFVIGYLALA